LSIGWIEKKIVKFQCNTHPKIHISKQLHQAEAFGVTEVLVDIGRPHEGHIIFVLLGPNGSSGDAMGCDGTPKGPKESQLI